MDWHSAQETPAKKKQSTDTIQHKKSKHTTQKSNTKKGDTINRQRTDKKGTTKSNRDMTPQRKDSINRP
ncbi:hypothetical protein [Flavobacterium sp.]|uniref:hypothetical protein n=1 Tax=Flavobacterium sp. TaxID=239 RepID=UPI0031D939F8